MRPGTAIEWILNMLTLKIMGYFMLDCTIKSCTKSAKEHCLNSLVQYK
jgi:hypothetical protein